MKIGIIAFTHKSIGLDHIGLLHLNDDVRQSRLQEVKEAMGWEELCYLSTCNRVEVMYVKDVENASDVASRFIQELLPNLDQSDKESLVTGAELYQGTDAVRHLLEVASSLDSLVVGEREIITQVRNSYEECLKYGLTGDISRIVVRQAIQTAKMVYTETDIAKNPVSVVSLAFKVLLTTDVPTSAKILIVGAGQTNFAMTNFLAKNGYHNLTVFNRTLEKAEKLAAKVNGQAYQLDKLASYDGGFDVIVTCTGSDDLIITKDIYKSLVKDDTDQKIVIDIAVPGDFDTTIKSEHDVNLIAVSHLRDQAERNLNERKKEIGRCQEIIFEQCMAFDSIYKQREIERAMSSVPQKVKEINDRAVNEVFAKEIEALDDNSKATLEKVMSYLEKKYISVPMKMAKEIMLDEGNKA